MANVTREWIAQFWDERKQGFRERTVYLDLMKELRDAASVAAQGAYFVTAHTLLVQSIIQLVVDEDAMAEENLVAAQSYLEMAIERDDLDVYGDQGHADIGRFERAKDLVLVRALRERAFDREAFAAACELKEAWNEAAFSQPHWEARDLRLYEWMAEQIVVGRYSRAAELGRKYGGAPVRAADTSSTGRSPEQVFYLVAKSQLAGDPPLQEAAKRALDGYYHSFTDWGPDFPEHDVPYDEKLLYAYIRGRIFYGIEDPIRLVKMLKFGV